MKWISLLGLGTLALVFAPRSTPPPHPQVVPLPDNTLVTGFTTRFAGTDVYDTAVAIAQAVYPATFHDNQPNAVILARPDRKADLFVAVRVIHHPVDAPILFCDRDRLPPATRAAMRRFKPEGFSYDGGVKAIVVGEISDAVVREVESLGYEVRRIRGKTDDPAELAAAVDDWISAIAADHHDPVLIASLDDLDFAMPGMSFLAHAKASLAFVTRDGIPEATEGLLKRHFGPAFMYLMGPESVISEDVARRLARYGHVQRIAAPDPYAQSALFAGYHDVGNQFGYWIGGVPRMFGWDIGEPGHNFTFANPEDWATSLVACIFSHRGKHGPMLLVMRDEVPKAVADYLDKVRPRPGASYDQLFNHGSVVGSTASISRRVQGRLDGLLAPRSLEESR